MKRLIAIGLWMIITAGVVVLVGFVLAEHKKSLCTGLEIDLKDADSPGFVNVRDIEEMIRDMYDPLQGIPLDSINTNLIYQRLHNNPYLKNVHVIKSLSGKIKARAERNQAIIRVVPENGESFYLSREGVAMPVHPGYVPNLRLATGIFREKPVFGIKNYALENPTNSSYAASEIASLYRLVMTLEEFPVLHQRINQIYLNSRGEFELIPVSGDHVIIVGKSDHLQHKLENLLAFYQVGKPMLKPGDYKFVDLRFMNQVICKNTIP